MKYSKLFFLFSLTLAACVNKINNLDNQSYTVIGEDSILNVSKDSSLLSQYQIKNGNKSGFYKLFDQSSGNLIEEGMMMYGKKSGVIKKYKESAISEVSYYEVDHLIYELDKDDFVLDSIDLDHFKINLPYLWRKNLNVQKNVLLLCNKVCSAEVKDCPILSITYEKFDGDLNNYVTGSFSALSKSADEFKVLTTNNYTLNGLYFYQARCKIISGTKKLGMFCLFFKRDNIVFVLIGKAKNENKGEFLKYDGLFEEIAFSIQ